MYRLVSFDILSYQDIDNGISRLASLMFHPTRTFIPIRVQIKVCEGISGLASFDMLSYQDIDGEIKQAATRHPG